MTVVPEVSRVRGLCHQLLMVLLINVPTMSLGMAMGWVSLVSGEREEADGVDPAAGTGGDPAAAAEAEGARVVAAAATTFLASLVGVPLSARALSYGRKFALIATSMCFVVCWSLKLVGGGWWVLAARVAAGLGGAGAYSIAPLVAREMCEKRVRGAAAAALIPAHNVGFLLMYLAADFALPHTTILWSCLSLSLLHCAVFLLVPESPAYLAANNKDKEAVASLAWLRGVDVDHPSLAEELAALPPPDNGVSTFALLKDMISDRSRRRAFIISFVAIVGQEACGVYTLMQFAERTFVLARDEATTSALEIMPDNATYALNATSAWNMSDILTTTMVPNATSALEHGLNAMNATVVLRTNALLTPARQAVVLGAVQLVASAIALYLVERVGRRRLLITSAFATGGCLAAGAGAAWAGRGGWAGAALAGAVAADNAGLQPAPYAMLADMFHYQFRSAVMMLSSAGTCVANAAEVMVFPALAARAGLPAALLLAALLTLSYAIFALFAVPETRGKTPEHIYSLLDKKRKENDVEGTDEKKEKDVEGTDEKERRSEPESDSTRVQLPAMGLLDKLSGWLGRGPTEVTVLVLGLDNSGKSTLLNALRPPEQRASALAPTVASTQDHFSSGGVAFSAWDVSGAPRHRALWERHYRRAHAVIFVVDAADHLRLVVAREELELMLAHPDMCGRRAPLLVFANKSDAPHALAPMQTATALGLERITDKPWHICASSAISGAGLADGVAWLARQLRDMHMHH
ncbi:facilitated trehalose transporter Tret1-like [Ostrinia nubilalis]|uniref:facilitated trehalose transporter Tret1-like n=1 Tax=Ostrinia nubilalis TaxID=29057 RepID=UPI0030824090